MNRTKVAFLAGLLWAATFLVLPAQTPSTCFEIESILVDACGGTAEGLNEMVLFHVGPTALNTANMNVAFPTVGNLWSGTCQSAMTASFVSQVNATITGCGRLVEPVAGVLPAGSRVMLFTSVNAAPTAQSFAGLEDTLIAIFHCASYTTGNFANFNATSSIRTTTMSFSVPSGCSDVVSYDRSLLANVNGAQVNFSWSNVATYVSPGCQGAYIPLNPDAGPAQSICAGTTTVNLAGTVSAGSRPFAWSGGTGSFTSTTQLNPVYTLGPGDIGSFYLYFTESSPCRDALDSILITIVQPPALVLPPDTSFCGNFSYLINAGLFGSSYAWSNGATTQNTIVTSPGTYTLTLTGSNGCIATDAIVIGSFNLPSLGLPNDTSVCAGQTLSISPNFAGTSYAWSTGASTAGIQVSTPGTYTVTATNANNCSGMDTFVLGNLPLPALVMGADTTICPGNGFVLNVDPMSQNIGASYAWSTGASSNAIAIPGLGTYAVTVTSAQGCIRIDTLQVSESLAPPINLGADTTLCQGASLNLNAGGGNTFTWNTGATTSIIQVTQAGIYSVSVSYGPNCSSTDTIAVAVAALPTVNLGPDTLYCPSLGLVLDAGGGQASYAWSNGATTQLLTMTAGGTYIVTVTNADGCDAVDSVNVAAGTDALVDLGPDVQLCPGSTVILDAGAGNTTYLWSTGATSQSITVSTPGTYWAVGTTSCGMDSAAIQVFISPALVADAGPDATMCDNDTLSLAAANAVGTSILWSASSGSFDNANAVQPNYLPAPGFSGNAILVLTVTDSCGQLSDTMNLEVLPGLSLVFSLPDTVCYQTAIEISFVGNPSSVLWLGHGSFSDSTGNPTIYYPAPGESGQINLSLLATSQCGTQTFPMTYYSEDTVVANFSFSPTTIYPATWVQFQNLSYLPGLPAHWSFGDEFFSTAANPQHQYYNPGTYDVELISYGAGGCNDTIVLPLTVIQPDTLIPNVFTPNGDGVNDLFDVLVPPTESFSLRIFDRWGKQLFLSTDPNKKWDGRFQNSEVPAGVYFYVIDMKPIAGGILSYNGPVTLMR